MQRCEFSGNADKPCPVPEGWPSALLRTPCEATEYGRNCAEIFGQDLVARTVDMETRQSSFDTLLGNIDAQFRLTSVPKGIAPDAIRQSISQVTFPLRERRPTEDGKVFVHHVDLYLTLLNGKKLEEANWYNDFALDEERVAQGFCWWCFETAEGQLSELSKPIDSINQYDKSFMMGAATLWNTLFPPLLMVREAFRGPSTIPISDFISEMSEE